MAAAFRESVSRVQTVAARETHRFSVPADDITPIPGEDYSTLPTEGGIAGRQWVVEKLREYPAPPRPASPRPAAP
ncbi:hypothetical protein GCM10010246_02400 [Streptomyces cuspidosporus]|uniref:Uncharacterized protein n=1 Tax=Streptomyces cuspidosporus TaxID=66882 RepID=A0ABN3FAN9_9ACTN